MPWRSLRAASSIFVKRKLDLRVEGLDRVPARGPVILAARHYHHLYDGAAIVSTIPRPVHILVALDWVQNSAARIGMDRACRAAKWPVVLRRDGAHPVEPGVAARALRQAIKETIALLADDRIVLIFPEAFPNIDPGFTPKSGDEFLPFRPGLVRLATLASASGLRVPIIPTGLAYQQNSTMQIQLRFGEPVWVEGRADEMRALQVIEEQVHELSQRM